jgi:hypothetical protein
MGVEMNGRIMGWRDAHPTLAMVIGLSFVLAIGVLSEARDLPGFFARSWIYLLTLGALAVEAIVVALVMARRSTS